MGEGATPFNRRVLVIVVLLAPLGCSRASSPAPSAGTSAASASAPVAPEPPRPERKRELERVIDANVGHAHFTRGMNRYTIEALDRACTPADIPVLGELLLSEDSIHAMTAAEVLALRGAAGRTELELAAAKVKSKDPVRFDLIDERLNGVGRQAAAPHPPGAASAPAAAPSDTPAAPVARANTWTTPADCSVYDRSPDYRALPPEDRARSRSTCETKEEFRAFAASRQACAAASDCTIVSGSCPFGCYVPVAKVSAPEVSAKLESLGARLDKAGNRCVYRCMNRPPADCVEKRCVEGIH